MVVVPPHPVMLAGVLLQIFVVAKLPEQKAVCKRRI